MQRHTFWWQESPSMQKSYGIVGSSNFTYSGFVGNSELNLQTIEPHDINKLTMDGLKIYGKMPKIFKIIIKNYLTHVGFQITILNMMFF